MYSTLIGNSLFNIAKPYCKKHALNNLDATEFIFMNTFFITLILTVYFIYIVIQDKEYFTNMYDKCFNLGKTEYFAIIAFSAITISSTFLTVNMDKTYNTPVINKFMMKAITTIIMICIGIYMFEESYSYSKIGGIALIVLGVYLLSNE